MLYLKLQYISTFFRNFFVEKFNLNRDKVLMIGDAPADVHTPAIDRLVARGVSFSNAYATAPICSPARVGLATGRYQQRWGNYWYGEGGLPNGIATIASTLRDLGYATKKVGKNHNNGGPAAHPLDHGFEEFLGFNHHTHDYLRLSEKDLAAYQRLTKQLGILEVGPLERDRGETVSLENSYTTEVFTDEAIEFIERDPDGRPFYLHLSHNAVHMPTYVGHPDYLERFGVPQPVWDRDADHWEFPFWDPRHGNWREWHENWGHLGAVDPYGRRRYLLQLAVLDDNIGRLMAALESSGQLDNTIIVFLSDNGGELNTYSNNRRLAGAKYMFGEGGIRIPMVLAYPRRVTAGIRRDDLVSTMDIFPTLLELVGGKAQAAKFVQDLPDIAVQAGDHGRIDPAFLRPGLVRIGTEGRHFHPIVGDRDRQVEKERTTRLPSDEIESKIAKEVIAVDRSG